MAMKALAIKALAIKALKLQCSLAWLAAALSLAAVLTQGAQARDRGIGAYDNYNIMAPEPGTAAHRVTRSKQANRPPGHAQASTTAQSASPLSDTPEQIETFKRNRRAFAGRGSSGLVLPTPLPGPTYYAPTGPRTVTIPNLPQEHGPTILPGSGRAIPNLPHGTETFQDRASRCAFQTGVYGVPGSATGSYMHNCAM